MLGYLVSIMSIRYIVPLFLLLLVVGILDSSYLTYERFSGTIPPCSTSLWVDCGKVLRSDYSVLFGIPLSLLGLGHYAVLLAVTILLVRSKQAILKKWVLFQSLVGALFSVYLIYVQLGLLHAICVYCMLSAAVSFALLLIAWLIYTNYETHSVVEKSVT